jgi:SRSO17 transposase
MAPRSKGELALDELDRLTAAGVRFGTVLADAGYGASAAIRQGLDARGLLWAVGIPRNQKVYSAAVQLVPPQGRGRRSVPNEEPVEAGKVLAGFAWRRIAWRQGTKGALAARFAAARIRWATEACGPTTGTCRATRSGWSASGAQVASESTTSAIWIPARHCASWQPPLRRAGSASRRTSSSSKNLVSDTSRDGLGLACTDMR